MAVTLAVVISYRHSLQLQAAVGVLLCRAEQGLRNLLLFRGLCSWCTCCGKALTCLSW